MKSTIEKKFVIADAEVEAAALAIGPDDFSCVDGMEIADALRLVEHLLNDNGSDIINRLEALRALQDRLNTEGACHLRYEAQRIALGVNAPAQPQNGPLAYTEQNLAEAVAITGYRGDVAELQRDVLGNAREANALPYTLHQRIALHEQKIAMRRAEQEKLWKVRHVLMRYYELFLKQFGEL